MNNNENKKTAILIQYLLAFLPLFGMIVLTLLGTASIHKEKGIKSASIFFVLCGVSMIVLGILFHFVLLFLFQNIIYDEIEHIFMLIEAYLATATTALISIFLRSSFLKGAKQADQLDKQEATVSGADAESSNNRFLQQRLECYLSLIPFAGFFVVLFMGAAKIYKRHKLLLTYIYMFFCFIPIIVFSIVYALIMRFFIFPLENVELRLTLLIIAFYFMMVTLALACIITRGFVLNHAQKFKSF